MNSVPDITVANDVGAVGGLRKLAQQDKEGALRAVAKQFEAIMMQQMLKSSRETSFDEGFDEDGASSMDSYREWRDDQLSQTLSTKGSLGLADMLVKQLLPKDKQQPTLPVDSAPKDKPLARTQSSSHASVGWWKTPAVADVPPPTQAMADVDLPSTQDALLLHNLLQGRVKTN
jgi:flagellar protein FlgJ